MDQGIRIKSRAFSMVWLEILQDPDVSDKGLRAYVALKSFHPNERPTYAEISSRMKSKDRDFRQLIRGLKELDKAGWVGLKNLANGYRPEITVNDSKEPRAETRGKAAGKKAETLNLQARTTCPPTPAQRAPLPPHNVPPPYIKQICTDSERGKALESLSPVSTEIQNRFSRLYLTKHGVPYAWTEANSKLLAIAQKCLGADVGPALDEFAADTYWLAKFHPLTGFLAQINEYSAKAKRQQLAEESRSRRQNEKLAMLPTVKVPDLTEAERSYSIFENFKAGLSGRQHQAA